MRRIGAMAMVLFALASLAAFASEQSEHLEHLRAMMAAASHHGEVIPQPDTITPTAAVTINISARSFSFTPSQFAVNQGDVITINISVPSNDPASIGHGILMDTYIPNGVNVGRGGSQSITFTATTAGTFGWICTRPTCGYGHSSMVGQMIVNAYGTPPPSISSIFPTSGSTAGGTAVIISGSNFQTSGTTTVKFDTTAATSVSVTSTTRISVVSPAHAAGTVNVTVTNPDGQSATASTAFTYATPGPSISSVTPSTGSTAGGMQITISGGGFQTGAMVTIGGIAASNVTVVNSSTITATTPLGPANEQVVVAKDVTVTNPDGSSATMTGAFTYFVPLLLVTSISPATGVTGGGTVVTITGTGFTTAVASSVQFGGVAASNVVILDAVTLQATAPAHAAGAVDVVVTIGGSSVTKANAFTYQNAPRRRRAVRH